MTRTHAHIAERLHGKTLIHTHKAMCGTWWPKRTVFVARFSGQANRCKRCERLVNRPRTTSWLTRWRQRGIEISPATDKVG